MGKKSNTKKKKRQLQKSKVKKVSFFSKLRKKIPKLIFPKVSLRKRQIIAGLASLSVLFVLVILGAVIFKRAFRPQEIGKLLPLDRTIATLEINSNLDHLQPHKTLKLLKDYPELSQDKLIQKLETKFEVNFITDLSPWLGRVVGATWINSIRQPDNLDKIYFAEYHDRQKLEEFLNSKASKFDHAGHDIYISAQSQNMIVLGDYLLFSYEKDALKELIDFNNSHEKSLNNSKKYRKISHNLPFNRTAFFFLNFENISDNLAQNLPIFEDKSDLYDSLKPFLNFFNSEGLSLIALQDKFAVQSFLNINSDKIKNSKYLSYHEKYTADLTDVLSQDVIAIWGGRNLEHQLKRMIEVLSGGQEASMEVFDRILQNYTQKYFGSQITLIGDLLPLFQNEFLLAIEDTSPKKSYKLLIELSDPRRDTQKLHQIAQNFAKIGAIFNPKVIDYTLPDGTPAKEIIAVPEEIQRQELTYKDKTVYRLKVGQNSGGLYYTVSGNTAIISDRFEGVKSSLNVLENPQESFKNSETFSRLIQPVLKSSDEVSYFDFERIYPIFFKGKKIPEFLLPLSSLSSGKNYFDDGISTINYIHIN